MLTPLSPLPWFSPSSGGVHQPEGSQHQLRKRIPGFLQPVIPSCLRRWSMSARMVWLPHCITALLQGIPHPQHSVENFKEEDVMLRMGFGDDVAAVDAASSSHFVPLSAMMRNHKVSDRPVPGESRGPEIQSLWSFDCWLDKTSNLKM
ncbi:uncharacterized protein LOC119008276 isoform X4 [Acanthopagrus latus]|uniref:uncharacterized protein LOC119008276 isoform X4 n=1 Tax=Acanthopagrus latus TaxID=8177 RepID=UPI00187BE69E|nr:uncharacterized protein LOC119008276 isoform X4 [Acanthopagrus latus]